jgi:hypothetical protein
MGNGKESNEFVFGVVYNLADTKTPFPGSKKPYKGLVDEKDRNDIIAYVCCSVYDLWIGN